MILDEVKIGSNCYIGKNSVIFPNFTMEENCILGPLSFGILNLFFFNILGKPFMILSKGKEYQGSPPKIINNNINPKKIKKKNKFLLIILQFIGIILIISFNIFFDISVYFCIIYLWKMSNVYVVIFLSGGFQILFKQN